mmetsp:Transcript_53261/g.116943  ORF Transcript_53261/g.116943 Transcript_53261/m.116943 type:complete len:255 (+) Transcript_53261:477-1241(+)
MGAEAGGQEGVHPGGSSHIHIKRMLHLEGPPVLPRRQIRLGLRLLKVMARHDEEQVPPQGHTELPEPHHRRPVVQCPGKLGVHEAPDGEKLDVLDERPLRVLGLGFLIEVVPPDDHAREEVAKPVDGVHRHPPETRDGEETCECGTLHISGAVGVEVVQHYMPIVGHHVGADVLDIEEHISPIPPPCLRPVAVVVPGPSQGRPDTGHERDEEHGVDPPVVDHWETQEEMEHKNPGGDSVKEVVHLPDLLSHHRL